MMYRKSFNRRAARVFLMGWAWASVTLLAQDANPGAANAPAPLPKGGFEVRTITAYVGYYSSGLANISGLQAGGNSLGYDVAAGGSATFLWAKYAERSNFTVTYTPSYTGQVRYSSLNAFNHSFSMNASRKIAPRWNLSFSVAGDLSSLQQSLFSPTALSNVAAVPATFDDLASGILASKFNNNPQLGTVLTNATLVQSPLQTLLYGQRVFTSSGHVSLSYSYSPRLSVTFSGGGSRTQPVSDDAASGVTTNSLLTKTTSGNASVAVSYSLSPLTQIGGTVTTNRISSTIQDAYTSTALASIGRTLSRRWFAQVHGGVGTTNAVRQSAFSVSNQPHPAFGGSLGFKTFSQTLLGSYDRTVSDPYGSGASTTSSVSGSWRWRQPGHAWWLESSVSWQRLAGSALGNAALTNTSGWNVSAGLGRAFGTHVALHAQYSYLVFGTYSSQNLSQNAVRVSLVWSPTATSLQ